MATRVPRASSASSPVGRHGSPGLFQWACRLRWDNLLALPRQTNGLRAAAERRPTDSRGRPGPAEREQAPARDRRPDHTHSPTDRRADVRIYGLHASKWPAYFEQDTDQIGQDEHSRNRDAEQETERSSYALVNDLCHLATLHQVGRTLAISCEAVPAVSCRRGHEAAPLVWYSCNQPGAAESVVSFIALFGCPVDLSLRLATPCRSSGTCEALGAPRAP
jgi:hypothetical protein